MAHYDMVDDDIFWGIEPQVEKVMETTEAEKQTKEGEQKPEAAAVMVITEEPSKSAKEMEKEFNEKFSIKKDKLKDLSSFAESAWKIPSNPEGRAEYFMYKAKFQEEQGNELWAGFLKKIWGLISDLSK